MISLKELANKVNGHLIGDGTIIISTVDDIHSASNESITFAFLPKYKKEISSSNAAAFVVTSADDLDNNHGIVVENPYLAMISILDFFDERPFLNSIFHITLTYMILLKNQPIFILVLFQLLIKM